MSGRDAVLDRCYKCGRFVPAEAKGSVHEDWWYGGHEVQEGECPSGFGCALRKDTP